VVVQTGITVNLTVLVGDIVLAPRRAYQDQRQCSGAWKKGTSERLFWKCLSQSMLLLRFNQLELVDGKFERAMERLQAGTETGSAL